MLRLIFVFVETCLYLFNDDFNQLMHAFHSRKWISNSIKCIDYDSRWTLTKLFYKLLIKGNFIFFSVKVHKFVQLSFYIV
jgi:hypothetical protein